MELIAKGLPEDSVGLIHSKAYDPKRAEVWRATRDPAVLKQADGRGPVEYASEQKTTENETRRFLLVTHSRIRSRRTDLD
jgi:hypothetical protein